MNKIIDDILKSGKTDEYKKRLLETITDDINFALKFLNGVIRNQEMLGSMLYQAPLYVPHECENGDGGLAQLIGFMKVR